MTLYKGFISLKKDCRSKKAYCYKNNMKNLESSWNYIHKKLKNLEYFFLQ